MKYFRISYVGYIEGEYDSVEDAMEEAVEAIQDDIEDNHANFCVEEYDVIKDEWK